MAAKSTRHVAFLAGINVGGHRLIAKDRLIELFEALKLERVTTFIASGNVLFDAPAAGGAKLEARIEKHLESELGYAVRTYVRSAAEIAAIVAFEPFAAAELSAAGHTLHVHLLRHALDAEASAQLPSFRTERDDFHAHGRELYWLCRGRSTDTLARWPALTKLIGASTARNITTMRKLAALMA